MRQYLGNPSIHFSNQYILSEHYSYYFKMITLIKHSKFNPDFMALTNDVPY